MAFRELCLESTAYGCDFPNGEDKARKIIGNSIVRLDESWTSLRRTTIAVACVAVASAKMNEHDERDLARELLSGMAGMMSQMSDMWVSHTGGVTGSSPDMTDIRRDSDSVDAVGQRLGAKADAFLGAVMTRLLIDLPKVWSDHFRLGVGSIGAFRSALEGNDEAWAIRQMVEEQRALAVSLVADIQSAMQEDSSQMRLASKWVEAARGTFDAAMAGGLGCGDSLVEVIRALGFPNVEEE